MAQVLAETASGRLEFDGNELSVISTVLDPPKVRLVAPDGAGSYGCLSGNRWSAGRQDERVLVILKPDADHGTDGGAIDWHVAKGMVTGDAAMVRLGTWAAAGGYPVAPEGGRVYASDRSHMLNVQTDGNVVVYAADGAGWRPVADLWSVLARLAALEARG